MSYKKHYDKINFNIEDRKEILQNFKDLRNSLKPKRESVKVALLYIAIGALWILFSDRLLFIFVTEPEKYNYMQTVKGWIYVLLSGLAFYFMISNRMILLKAATDRIYKGYEELDKSYEDLKDAQEELKDKYNLLDHYKNALSESQLTYSLSIEGSNDGVWNWNIDNDEFYTSILSKPEFGYTDDESKMINTMEKWRSLFHPEDLEFGKRKLETFIDSRREFYENIVRINTKFGEYRWILSKSKVVRNETGKALRFAGSHTDLTDQIKLKDSLRREQELVNSIANESPTVIVVCDKNGQIVKFNQFAEKLLEFNENEVIGTSILDFLLPFSTIDNLDELLHKLYQGETMSSMEISIKKKDKQEITLLWNNSFLHDTDNVIEGFVFIGVDITQRKMMEEKLESLAYYDSLTNLPNREKFKDDFNESIKNNPTGELISVAYLDIDNFKLVNDSMGHDAGDELLLFISDSIEDVVKNKAKLYRFGGDEFVLMFNEVDNFNSIEKLMGAVINVIRKPWIYNNQEFVVSASAGIAAFPDHGSNFETIMRNSDTALAYAKESGKNKFLIYSNYMRLKTLEYMQLSNDLRNAISSNQFYLVYQPQIDLKTEEIIGAEALIRWEHPIKGNIPPLDFIPFAEESGHIESIEEWVIQSAYSQKKIWNENGYKDFKLAVNISGKMLSKDKWVDRIKECFIQEEIIDNVIFEITETSIISDVDAITNSLYEIKELGVKIALDDFGTGYSSLTYLQKLPIDVIKLDRDFIWSIGTENDKSPIIKTVIDLSHELNIKVVAEGVETLEQLDFLKKANCDYAQGFYFYKPLLIDDINELIKK